MLGNNIWKLIRKEMKYKTLEHALVIINGNPSILKFLAHIYIEILEFESYK
jgi:hypothetical protein